MSVSAVFSAGDVEWAPVGKIAKVACTLQPELRNHGPQPWWWGQRPGIEGRASWAERQARAPRVVCMCRTAAVCCKGSKVLGTQSWKLMCMLELRELPTRLPLYMQRHVTPSHRWKGQPQNPEIQQVGMHPSGKSRPSMGQVQSLRARPLISALWGGGGSQLTPPKTASWYPQCTVELLRFIHFLPGMRKDCT